MDRALGDDDPVSRSLRDELELGGAIDAERAEVARVDADDASVEARGALELLVVVSLHERVEAELFGDSQQSRGRRVVEVAQDEERRVRAGLPHLAQLLLRREEALREQRHASGRPCSAKVVERARERGVDEDGDGARSTRLVRRHDVLDA